MARGMWGPKPTEAERAHAYVGFRSTALLGGVASLVMAAVYFAVGAAVAAVAAAAAGVTFFALRLGVREKHVEAGLLVVIACALAGFVAVARDLGGLTSPPVVWLPLMLRATYLALGRRIAVPGAVMTAVAVVAALFVARDPPVVSTTTLEILRVASVITALASAIAGAANHERQRKKELQLVEEAARVKTDLLATVSHELRTPLAAIAGMADLLLDTKLDDTQRTQARTVRAAAATLVVLVDDLLEASRLEAGRVTLHEAPCNVGAIAASVVELLAVRARDKGLALTLDVAPGIPRVVADSERLARVLTNLVDNALKFTPSGSVSMRVHAEPVDAERVRVVVDVVDTGIGIAADKQAAIFERFTQADSSTTRRYGGTGLGLAIASDLLALMGGAIGVRSEVGRGSTFTASLVLRVAAPAPSLDGKRVLLAEDNVVNQQVAVHLLTSLGCSVDVAKDGNEAVAMAKGGRYDVVLMDCHMPEMDGYRAAAAIRAHAGQALPILALTAGGSPEDIRRARDAGMDAFLQKPIDVDGIRDSLGRVVKP